MNIGRTSRGMSPVSNRIDASEIKDFSKSSNKASVFSRVNVQGMDIFAGSLTLLFLLIRNQNPTEIEFA
jgi:hypothetical protein